MMRSLLLTVTLVAGLIGSLSAQDLEGTLSDVGKAYAQNYMQPMVDAMGANLNSGLFHSANVGGGIIPLVDVYVGLKVPATVISSDMKTFDMTYTTDIPTTITVNGQSETFTGTGTFQVDDAPTVFGPSETNKQFTAEISYSGSIQGRDTTFTQQKSFAAAPGLGDIPLAPFPVPHAEIGTLMGTDLQLRYLPPVGLADYGSVRMTGIGVRHNISQYLPMLPVSVAAQIFRQNISIDVDDQEVVDISALAGNVQVSKSLLLLTVYGGLQLERSGIDVSYTYQPETGDSIPVTFSADGSNSFRVIGGAKLNLGPLKVNADVSLGNVTVVTAGLGLGV